MIQYTRLLSTKNARYLRSKLIENTRNGAPIMPANRKSTRPASSMMKHPIITEICADNIHKNRPKTSNRVFTKNSACTDPNNEIDAASTIPHDPSAMPKPHHSRPKNMTNHDVDDTVCTRRWCAISSTPRSAAEYDSVRRSKTKHQIKYDCHI